jgi:hypothetical protein
MFHHRPALRGLDNWIEGDPGTGLDDDEPDTCECDHCGEDFTPRDISDWRVGLCLPCYIRQRDREAGGY